MDMTPTRKSASFPASFPVFSFGITPSCEVDAETNPDYMQDMEITPTPTHGKQHWVLCED